MQRAPAPPAERSPALAVMVVLALTVGLALWALSATRPSGCRAFMPDCPTPTTVAP